MRKINVIALFTAILTISITSNLLAQTDSTETESPFSISCDLMSRYLWRGTDFGASPSIQPGFEFSKKGLAIGAWGAFSTNLVASQELDLYVSYTIKDMFSITITDYFFPNETAGAIHNYFDYNDLTTGHVFEGTLSFNGTEKLPLSVLIAANIFGADARKSDNKIQYSTYAELAYSFKNADVFIGFNLTNPDEDAGESGFYGHNFGVVNLGISTTKKIKITDDYNLPLSVSLITNPKAERIYLVAGFSF